ncbi:MULTISPECIES: hypothetical protein [unclassified Burkholderia]|uniref:hypothetical protein n=1 Tax=unclassified Burkholderia TaxID=2613784 RepID=UPI0007585DA2|nr:MULTISPECIES: hypothetical protein [unclassified Burkholderia]KVN17968.1 hypothetical protein WT08_02230 [Burkholderia sp. MSMB1552]KWZ55482.1 hypothetical protein WS92_05850 [Burkholderia sp. MSMB1588]
MTDKLTAGQIVEIWNHVEWKDLNPLVTDFQRSLLMRFARDIESALLDLDASRQVEIDAYKREVREYQAALESMGAHLKGMLSMLSDHHRTLIEQAEDRLRGRSAEDTVAANGLLEVLIAHPITQQPSYCDIHCKKFCQNSVHGMCDGPPPQQSSDECPHGIDDGACKHCYQEATEPRGEVTDWWPIETAPTDVLVAVFWLDSEDEKNPERYDFDMLEDGCWRQWTDHYEWAHSVAPAGSLIPRERPPYTHWKPLGVPTDARPQGSE